MKIAYHSFQGSAPRIAPRLLPNSYSQEADNTKLWSGELRPFYGDAWIKDVPDDTKSIYKYKSSQGTDIWLSWNRHVTIVKDSVYGDINNRVIISGLDGGLRVTDSTVVGTGSTTISSTNSYTLGVPRPDGTIIMNTGTTPDAEDVVESRSYVVVWVREWPDGKLDLSAPSDPAQTPEGETFLDVSQDQTVTLTNILLPSEAFTDARVRKGYVYRTGVGTDGSVAYRFVGEFAVSPSVFDYTFEDTVPTIELGEVLVSGEWDAPKKDLSGLISLNNGVLAAFSGSDVYMSYPFQAHAWPETYRVSVDSTVIGLGSFGNNIVVCTTSNPVIILVGDPASATVQPIAEAIPCVSAASIVSTAAGVLYATQNGLCKISNTQPDIVTDPYLTRDEWLPTNPKSLIAAVYDRSYFGFFLKPTYRWGFVFDLDLPTLGIVHLARSAKAIWSDPEDLSLYLVTSLSANKTSIVKFDSDETSRRSFKWRSKIERSQEGLLTFSAARVRAAYLGGTGIQIGYVSPYEPLDNTINARPLNEIEINGPANMASIYATLKARNSVTFRYIVDGRVKYEKRCVDILPFRLPSGFRGWEHEIELEAGIPVHYVEIATSMAELT